MDNGRIFVRLSDSSLAARGLTEFVSFSTGPPTLYRLSAGVESGPGYLPLVRRPICFLLKVSCPDREK